VPVVTIESIEQLKTYEGTAIGETDWMPIGQDRIQGFAEVTGDHQWIHVDPERAARESPFGRTVAHGFLTLALLSSLWHQVVQFSPDFRMIINYGLNRVRFPAPVPAGSRIRARFEVQSVEDGERGAHVVWNVTAEAEGSKKPCLVAEWITRVYR